MKLTSVAILINKKKNWVKKAQNKIKDFLKKNNIKILDPKKAQMIIVIGGDGTLLYYKNFFSKPFLLIGTSKSWLAEATNKNYLNYLKKILKNGFTTTKRSMISASINKKIIPDCLNELTIRNKEHRIVEFRLKIKNKKYTFLGDGIIFSTATGSTAYAYSCGGKEMNPKSSNYQIVPIAAYRRAFKPKIVNGKIKTFLFVKTTCKTDAVIDGQIEIPLPINTKISTWISKKKLELVKSN